MQTPRFTERSRICECPCDPLIDYFREEKGIKLDTKANVSEEHESRHIMIKTLGHAGTHRRVAINVGAGFVPGTNAVVMGAAIAGGKLGWEMVGIRDGFEGLLHPDRYPDGGLVTLSPELIENLDPATGGILGQAPRVDPFHVRTRRKR